jgi:putative ABC transport system substrate-binding protein
MAPDQAAYLMSRRRVGRTLLGLLIAPLIATAQRSVMRRIGRLGWGTPDTPEDIWKQAGPLRELGWVEGKNLQVERRYANSPESLKQLADELVGARVDVIVSDGSEATRAAMRATTTIPIVFRTAGDPVGLGLVASLARPGGNVTGYSAIGPQMQAKALSLLKDLLPPLNRVGVVESSGNPQFQLFRAPLEEACRSLGLKPVFVRISAGREIDDAIAGAVRQGVQALLLRPDDFMNEHMRDIARAALRYGLPTMTFRTDYVHDPGILAAYQIFDDEMDRRTASFIDRILRGAKPGELPVEQPTRFAIAINLKTARALGLTIPQSLLLRADEVIQ